MRTFHLLVAMAIISIVTSCGASKKAQQNPNGYQQQYQSQNGPDEAGFVEVKKSPILELSLATGTSEIRAYGAAESGNEQMAFNAARAQAIAALQEKIQVYVQAGLKSYNEEVGVNSEYALDEHTRNEIVTAVKGIVNGAEVLETRKLYNSNTGRYKYEVCVRYNKSGILGEMQQQSNRIRQNEQQFEKEMQAAWDALDAENHKILYSNGQNVQ